MDATGADAAGDGVTRTLKARHMIASQASESATAAIDRVRRSVVWLLSQGSPTMTLDARACWWSELRLGWLIDQLQVSAAIDVSCRAEKGKAR